MCLLLIMFLNTSYATSTSPSLHPPETRGKVSLVSLGKYDRPTQITLLELISICKFSEIQTCKFYKLSSYNNETSYDKSKFFLTKEIFVILFILFGVSHSLDISEPRRIYKDFAAGEKSHLPRNFSLFSFPRGFMYCVFMYRLFAWRL